MLLFLHIPDFLQACSYRAPMMVREVMIFSHRFEKYGYYVCPRCQITVEREFMNYCDHCGQCLNWARYEQATIVYPGSKQRRAKAKRLGLIEKLYSKFRFGILR